MAIGDVTYVNQLSVAWELLASATATNSPPTTSAQGLAIAPCKDMNTVGAATRRVQGPMSLVIASTAGSATMTVTCRLWGHLPLTGVSVSAGVWVPLGTGTGAAKGVINAGSAIDETGTDTIRHVEPVNLLAHFDRVYLEITAIGGTATAITAWLVGSAVPGTEAA